jgi:protoporphyrin/coproporphyrin ferrochelatase
MPSKKTGVVLFQLGGPDSLESIEPFLYNLFCDPDIIDFPFARLARKPLAKLISTTRAKHVAHHYAGIGGKSPLLDFTQRQAEALERDLRRDLDAKVTIAMRYWHPLTEAAVAEMRAFAPDEIVLLPLYPQYSKTTTGSSINEWNRCTEQALACSNVRLINTFYEDPAYLGSVVTAINACFDIRDNLAEFDIVFSAHSVPIAVIEAGDPYQSQIERTVDLVWKRGGWPARRHTCYQSKVGASKWLRPSMHETVKKLAADGSKHVLVVPISFVSDHVETLHEIDIEHREQARNLGIEDFRMMPGLNDSPDFIRALAGLVRAGSLDDAKGVHLSIGG